MGKGEGIAEKVNSSQDQGMLNPAEYDLLILAIFSWKLYGRGI